MSYVFLKKNTIPLPCDACVDWMLDSGAFSAFNSGKKIDNNHFIDFALEAKNKDPKLADVFALDVIGDYRRTMQNAIEARRRGLDVIPTWHVGEPIEHAKDLCYAFDKVAIGGLVGRAGKNRGQQFGELLKKRKLNFFFETVWPKWIHGFGCTGDELLMSFPFASVDSTTWRLRPSMYGSWKSFGRLPVRLTKSLESSLTCEVNFFLRMQKKIDHRWRKELLKIKCEAFKIHFACVPSDLPFFSKRNK